MCELAAVTYLGKSRWGRREKGEGILLLTILLRSLTDGREVMKTEESPPLADQEQETGEAGFISSSVEWAHYSPMRREW